MGVETFRKVKDQERHAIDESRRCDNTSVGRRVEG